ncbi:MAG TPA: hypothetical protein VFP84_07975 [Kofleriaceae bacterium]|nr:hypothetical protein [Kofleriaceae bacterium]
MRPSICGVCDGPCFGELCQTPAEVLHPIMRALWAFVVVCLMAASGVAPARAAARTAREGEGEPAMRAGHGALPAVTSAHVARLLVGVRPRAVAGELPAVAPPVPPVLVPPCEARVVAAARRVAPSIEASLAIRSARGPPAH